MSQPVLWPTKTFFYPVGNTPAVHLTASLPPEQRADVLLLGCGDVRNILFTVYMESEHLQKELDFTCNDHEPAILARNLLLYTLLLDDPKSVDLKKLWNIYYHFYLDKPSLQLLYTQCRKVLELSTSIETWNSHKYGQHLRFCSDSTLEAIRHHCELYLETETFDRSAKRALEDAFSKGMSETRASAKGGTSWRAAGAAYPLALSSKLCEDHFTAFWKTGLSAGTPTSGCTHVNPTFAHSRAGRGFNPHYAFQERCNTSKSPSPGLLCIRFLLGDVLSAAKALRRFSLDGALDTNVYASPWGGRKITFLPSEYTQDLTSAPTQFNVIDSSNVSDHVGLLNIVLTTLPLLRPSLESRLSTHRLTRTFDRNAPPALRDIGLDLPLISAITGLVLTRVYTSISTTSVCHEPAMCGMQSSSGTVKQFNDPLNWRFAPPNAPRMACEPKALAEALFVVYTKLYEDEDLPKRRRGPTGDLILYDRAAFAELLCQARRALAIADWEGMMDHLIDLITSDRTLLVGSNQFQDLFCHLFLRGLWTADPLREPSKRQVPHDSPLHPSKWANSVVPTVVCVILVIPREHIRVLEEKDVSTHNIQCHTSGGPSISGWNNVHSSIRPIFGTVRRLAPSDDSSDPNLELVEDPLAWKGTSDLVVSFYMPSWILTLNEPASTTVMLVFQNTMATVAALMFELGPRLKIYGTTLDDTEHVFVCAARPDNLDDLANVRRLAGQSVGEVLPGVVENSDDESLPVSATLNFSHESKQATSIVLRADIGEPTRKAALGAKKNAVVRGEDGNHSITMKYGRYRQIFVFPFPVDIGVAKVRVARKSSYLEVEAQVQVDPESSKEGFINPFEVQLTGASPLLSNTHYTSLDLLPSLAFKGQKIDWIKTFNVRSMLSDREGDETPATEIKYSLRDIKDGISFLFQHFIEGNGKPLAMGLTKDGNDCDSPSVNAIFFISKLRLDLQGASLILDGCFQHLDQETMLKDPKFAAAVQNVPAFRMLTVPEDAMTMWKKKIPAMVERCRTWSHTPNCSYQGKTIPLSTGARDDPICECGRGKGLGPFVENKAWKPLAPFVTRIAVGLVFPSNFEAIWLLNATSRLMAASETGVDQAKPSVGNSYDKKEEEVCWKCRGSGGSSGLLRCSRCKEARYCTNTCQKADWKTHKRHCSLRT
ncbi:hypothetical protein BKA70DRAFT_1304682 [Coprinopsis sp. MPI-PUGE-AT-0042]|nr:hypothetical protein BKA70DRAFT_1304682 [Coprinopsis sp. MPI-PUGE-AT-0042]